MPQGPSNPNDERVLICTPTGRDAVLTEAALADTGLCVESCPTIEEVCERIRFGAIALLIAGDALTPRAQELLADALAQQPTWSDIPVIVLTSASPTPIRNAKVHPLPATHVTLLERPVRRAVLVSAVETARRARVRQYELRDHLAERARHETELRDGAHREQELRSEAQSARERLEAVLRGITDGLFILDRAWCYTYANAASAAEHGVRPNVLIDRYVWEFYPDLRSSDQWRLLTRAMETRTPIQFDWYCEATVKWYHWRAYPAPDGLAIFSADVTDRKAAEHAAQMYLERQENIAETLQRSLLGRPTSYEGIEIVSHYEAASAEAKIGGDFYDVFAIDDFRVALVVGDVVGKGLAAAAHTAEVKFALRAIVREDARPNVAMERLNSYLVDAQRLDDAPHDKLVALSLAVWDRSTCHISVALAASEAPLIVSPTGQASPIGPHGVVLGAGPKSAYESATTPLLPGHTIVMLTDGITEARRGKEFYGIEGVALAIERAWPKPSLTDLGDSIVSDAKSFAGGTLRDDACVLLARVQG